MEAFGLPPGTMLVADVLELERYAERGALDLQLPAHAAWSSWEWKKTDIGPSVAAAVSASRQVLGGDVRALCGWAITETTGATAAAIRFHDGRAANTEVFARVNLAANESNREYPTPHGLECATGAIFLEVLSGSVEGVVFWR